MRPYVLWVRILASSIAVLAAIMSGTAQARASTVGLQQPWKQGWQLPWATGQKINGSSPSIWYGNSYGQGDHVGRDFWAIDFNMPDGTLVTPVANGIAHVSYTVCGGYSVWIDHGGGFSSYYGHLNGAHILVSEGQAVTQGQTVIAWSDNSGDHNSIPPCITGPHLHFEMQTGSTNGLNGNAYKPEPMSGYTGFGQYGSGTASPAYTSSIPTMVKTDLTWVPGDSSYQTNLANGLQQGQYTWATTNGTGFPGDFASNVYPGNYFYDNLTSLFLYNPLTGAASIERPTGTGGWTKYTSGATFGSGWQVFPGNYVLGNLTSLFFYNATTGSMWVDAADGAGGWISEGGQQWVPNLTIYPGYFANHWLTDIFVYNPSTGGENVFIATGNGSFIVNSPTGGTFNPATWSVYLGDLNGDWRTDLFLYIPATGATWMLYAAFNTDGSGGWSNGHATASPGAGFNVYPGHYNGGGSLTDLFMYNSSSGQTRMFYANGNGDWSNPPYDPRPTWAASLSINPGHFNSSGTLTDLFVWNPNTFSSSVQLASGDGRWNAFATSSFVAASLTLGNYDYA